MEPQVRACYHLIIKEVDPNSTVLDALIQERIIEIDEADRIRNILIQNNGARALMRHLYSKTDSSVFDVFVKILDKNYKDLAKKIRTVTVTDLPKSSTPENDRLKGRVRDCFGEITGQMDPRYQVCDYLFMKRVIIIHQTIEEINKFENRKQRARELLSYLDSAQQQHPTAYVAFVEALESTEYPHLAQFIRGSVDTDLVQASGSSGDAIDGEMEFDKAPPTLVVKVFEDKTFFDKYKHDDSVYPMTTTPRGRTHIINVQTGRDGTDADRDKLVALFEQLNFCVETYNDIKKPTSDLTANGILEIVKASVRDPQLASDQCYVLFILAHGDLKMVTLNNGTKEEVQVIHGSDGLSVRIDQLFELLENCDDLKEKPKLVFFKTCRGVRLPDYDAKDDKLKDFFICYSTQKGYKSMRWPYYGSWFVHCITNVFMEKACNTDVATMIDEVDKLMFENSSFDQRPDGKVRRECLDKENYLKKTLYLFPKTASQKTTH